MLYLHIYLAGDAKYDITRRQISCKPCLQYIVMILQYGDKLTIPVSDTCKYPVSCCVLLGLLSGELETAWNAEAVTSDTK